jgi:hypothetical protein
MDVPMDEDVQDQDGDQNMHAALEIEGGEGMQLT